MPMELPSSNGPLDDHHQGNGHTACHKAHMTTIKQYCLDKDSWDGFSDDVDRVMSQQGGVECSFKGTDGKSTLKFASAALQCVLPRLPLDLVYDLQKLLYDPDAPCAIHIKGLPIDANLPETPREKLQKGLTLRLPVSESVIMALASLVGTPFTLSAYAGTNRDGLLMDLVPDYDTLAGKQQELDMHRDHPFACENGTGAILLSGLRAGQHEPCKTMVCDSRVLIAALPEDDASLLRTHGMQVVNPKGKAILRIATVIHSGPQGPMFNLFDEAIFGDGHCMEGVADCPDVASAVFEAYKRAQGLAYQLAQPVFIGPGDLLVFNNYLCTHGRTPFAPRCDGTDRWLLRVMVKRNGELWAENCNKWPDLVTTLVLK